MPFLNSIRLRLTQLNSTLPLKIEEIIEKALEKDRDLRYQSAADLRGDLKRLKRDMESGRKAVQAGSGNVPVFPVAASSSALRVDASPVRASGSSAVISAARQNKLSTGLLAGVVVVLVAAAAYGIYAFVTRSRTAPFQNISILKVTDTGQAALVAISPDDKYILYVMKNGGQQGLWLRNLPTNSDTEVIKAADVEYSSLRFSPDGNYLYFSRSEPGSHELKYLYRTPVLGGTPEKLVTDIDSPITFSPDGKEFAFFRFNNPEAGRELLIIKSVEGGNEKIFYSGPTNTGLQDPAWSPDGKMIVCMRLQPGNALGGLVAMDIQTGKQKLFFTSATSIVQRPVWMANGSGLVALSGLGREQLIFVSYPGGESRSITRDTNDYSDPSLAVDGHSLVTVLSQGQWNLFTMPAGGKSGELKQVISGAPLYHFSWTSSAQLVRESRSGISLLDPETGSNVPLPSHAPAWTADPSACGDGRYIVFTSGVEGGNTLNIWRMDAGGGNLKQLSDGKVDQFPVCSRDGRWVVYEEPANGGRMMKISIEGGRAEPVTEQLVGNGFDISPDSKAVAFAAFGHLDEHVEKLMVVALDSGQTLKTLPFDKPRSGAVRFFPDGKAVVYPVRTGGVDNLWSQPLDGSPGKQITDFPSEQIIDFHWSNDGSKLGVIRGHVDSDVVLIRDSKQ